jgi:hypothetical protein
MKWWALQVFKASSRLLNALTGGEGDTTSAYSWELKRRGSKWGEIRVWILDGITGYDHCKQAWDWHEAKGLFE